MTDSVVEALEAQHRSLERLVLELNTAVARGDSAVAGEKLSAVRKLLEGHLGIEDTQFYPRFLELAAGRESTLAVVKLFQTNMKTIADSVTVFFDRYEGKPMDLALFVPDWKIALKTLAVRMKQEEETLHPMFRKLLPKD